MKFEKGKMYSIKLDNGFWCIGRYTGRSNGMSHEYSFDVIVDVSKRWGLKTFSITSQRDYEIEEVTKETHPEHFL